LLFTDEDDAPPDVFHTSSTPRKSMSENDNGAWPKTPQCSLTSDKDGGYLSALSEIVIAASNSVKKSHESGKVIRQSLLIPHQE